MAIFISHSSHDHAAVRSLIQNLQTAHESVWLDQSLIGGEEWWQRILHQIRSCTVFIVALSNSCLQSKPCRAEIDYAKALGLPVLPVIIGDVDSYRLDPIFTVQSVDFRNPDAASAAALIAAVRERAAERNELPDPLPEPPPVPYEYLQRLGVAIDSPEELSPTEQTTILADLRHALRQEDDESVREDIRRLLGALRRRSEVTHGTVEEIDDLLARYPATRADAAAPPERQQEAAHTAKATTPQADAPALLVGKPAPPNGTTESTKPRLSRRNPKAIAIAAGAGVLIAIIAVVAYLLVGRTSPGSTANKPATTTSTPPPPVPVAALDGLLLSPDQINSAMGTTGMGIAGNGTDLANDAATVADVNCRGIDSVQEVSSYAGSGWTAVRDQLLRLPLQGDHYDFFVAQGVASFPSANAATGLFTAVSQRWPDCSNHRYTSSTQPPAGWTTGPLSNTNGTLSITTSQEGGNGWNCQRALTATNNIVIDISACSLKPTDAAVNIAHQIAAKVAKQ
jgi:serine/threonine kinase PknH